MFLYLCSETSLKKHLQVKMTCFLEIILHVVFVFFLHFRHLVGVLKLKLSKLVSSLK